MTNENLPVRNGIHPLAAFLPFSPLTIKVFHASMPLKWIALFTVLQAISLIAFYLNFVANDLVWLSLALWAYILIAMPVYTISVKNNTANSKTHQQTLTFRNLFNTCAKAVFSDYRISLVSKIPLTLQVLAGGSLLYEVFGADWILHGLAGFGIGALALTAYSAGVGYYGYGNLASYFRLSRFRTFKVERLRASSEFTLFSIVVVALIWEVFERSVHFASPVNVFRIGGEPLWNIFGDVFFAICGGMIAHYLLTRKFKWHQ